MATTMIETLAEAMVAEDPVPMSMFERGDVNALVRAVLTSLREQAGDPGIVEAMGRARAAGWTDAKKDGRGMPTSAELHTASLTAALDHILKEG